MNLAADPPRASRDEIVSADEPTRRAHRGDKWFAEHTQTSSSSRRMRSRSASTFCGSLQSTGSGDGARAGYGYVGGCVPA